MEAIADLASMITADYRDNNRGFDLLQLHQTCRHVEGNYTIVPAGVKILFKIMILLTITSHFTEYPRASRQAPIALL